MGGLGLRRPIRANSRASASSCSTRSTGENVGARPSSSGDGNTTFIPDNALVASPAAYNAFQLDPAGELNRSPDHVTRVYIPDIHGRIWKFNTSSGGMVADEGPAQPFGVPVALLKIADQRTRDPARLRGGRRRRRVPGHDPFKMFGYPGRSRPTATSRRPHQGCSSRVPGTDPRHLGRVPRHGAAGDGVQRQRTRRWHACSSSGTRFNFTTIDCISTLRHDPVRLGAVSGTPSTTSTTTGRADLSTIVEGVRATVLQTAGGQVRDRRQRRPGRPPVRRPRRPVPVAAAALSRPR